MDDYISISTLNDYIFCPYSIYLHNVYMGADEDIYHATPQTKGKNAHVSIDTKTYSTLKEDLMSMPVYSDELGVMGKIDLYKSKTHTLIERKYQLKTIYQGQIYQLWTQYVCMTEMGYKVDNLSFFEISTHKTINIGIPTKSDLEKLKKIICEYRQYEPSSDIIANPNKCKHCIYCNLCDKADSENVFT